LENLLVVDVQPMYHQSCEHMVDRLVTMLNLETPYTTWYYVSEETGIGDDTEADVCEYLLNYGLSEEAFERITFVPKDYGFLRGWMDTGVDDETIVDTLKLMRQLGLSDSRDLVGHATLENPEHEHIASVITADYSEVLIEPNFNVQPLLTQSCWDVAGGGRYECLKELELYAMSHGIEFSPKDHSLIYG
jgi:hypothetical protein